MRIIYISTVLIFGTLLFAGCSTLINTTTQEVELKTEPINARIYINGKRFGTTPQKINIERGTSHVVKFEFDGYELYETQITQKISTWFWSNALNGFVPGMLVDMFTGSMYNLLPDKIDVQLTQAKIEVPVKKK